MSFCNTKKTFYCKLTKGRTMHIESTLKVYEKEEINEVKIGWTEIHVAVVSKDALEISERRKTWKWANDEESERWERIKHIKEKRYFDFFNQKKEQLCDEVRDGCSTLEKMLDVVGGFQLYDDAWIAFLALGRALGSPCGKKRLMGRNGSENLEITV